MSFCLSCPVISWKQRIQKDQPQQWFNPNYYPNADPGCVAANFAFNVSVGSKADLAAPKSNFRFTPESGLKSDITSCPKSAQKQTSRRLASRILRGLAKSLFQECSA